MIHSSARCGASDLCLGLLLLVFMLAAQQVHAQNQTSTFDPKEMNQPIWPGLAPGESSGNTGEPLPPRARDNPLITRIEKITQPTIDVFPAEKPTGAAVLILPGGGFRYVVTDLEGSEAAKWLNDLGITAFVLRYRTSDQPKDAWKRPLQDSQRAIRWIRTHADTWGIDRSRVGLLGFSAGGHVACIHLTSSEAAYDELDEIDSQSIRPDFSLLIYPWKIYDETNDSLVSTIQVNRQTPPAFLVHTHDDNSTSLGAVHYYAQLKHLGIQAELHVYQNGGHGYGTRPRPNSVIGTWTQRGTDWLRVNGF